MSRQTNDSQTVKNYLSGNKEANQLIDKYIQTAFSRWQHKFGFETDDIISDVRFKIFVSLKNGDFRSDAKLETYINRIVNHTCIDMKRYTKKFTSNEIFDILPTHLFNPEKETELKQVARLVFRVLRQLPRECITMWRMHLYQNMNYSEIGKTMGKSEGNIRRRIWACRETAKEFRGKILKKDKHLEN